MLVQEVNMEIGKFNIYNTYEDTEVQTREMNQRNHIASYRSN